MTEQESTIKKLQDADITVDDWVVPIIGGLEDKYAKGYIACEIGIFGEYYGSSTEDFREELIKVCQYDIWGK